MNIFSGKNNKFLTSLPKWLKALGLFIMVFIIVSLIGILPEIGFLRSYFGEKINQMAFERSPGSILWETPTKIPGKFNEIANNYDATISADGTVAIFSHRFAENNYDLYISRKINGTWSPPQPIKSINTDYNEQNPTISQDGKLLFFSSDRPSGKGGFDIWCSVLTKDNEWSSPYLLGGDVNTKYDEIFPEIAPLQNALFFSSNRPLINDSTDSPVMLESKHNNFHIYRAIRTSESGEIVSLGPPAFAFVENVKELNSPKNEGKVAVSKDGGLIYLSSNRDGGYGGYDIYVSALKNGKYITPINFKTPINTEYDEISPFMQMETFKILFSSNKNSRSYRDFHIYESQSHQVFSAINTEIILLMLLIVVLFVSIFLLLKYLMSNSDLSLLTKCFLISIVIHLIALLILSTCYLRAQITREYSDEGELSINIDNLARENIAAALKEGIASLPKQSSQSFAISKEEAISGITQLNQQASAIIEPKDYKAGENVSLSSPESIASLDQASEDISPYSDKNLSLSSIPFDNNLKFVMERPAKTKGKNQFIEQTGTKDGSGISNIDKISGKKLLSNVSPTTGIPSSKNLPSIASFNTADIKGDRDNIAAGSNQQNLVSDVSGLTDNILDNKYGPKESTEDILQDKSISNIIASRPEKESKGKKLYKGAEPLPAPTREKGIGRALKTEVPDIGYLNNGNKGINRTLAFPLRYLSNGSQYGDLTGEISFIQKADTPFSTYLGTYFFVKKFILTSIGGIIYRNTVQFTLPANTELEVSDQYLLTEQNKRN